MHADNESPRKLHRCNRAPGALSYNPERVQDQVGYQDQHANASYSKRTQRVGHNLIRSKGKHERVRFVDTSPYVDDIHHSYHQPHNGPASNHPETRKRSDNGLEQSGPHLRRM